MTIGERIREERLARRLTQSVCGARMGVSRSRWADIEAGRKSMTLDTLGAVAKALGLQVEIRLVEISL